MNNRAEILLADLGAAIAKCRNGDSTAALELAEVLKSKLSRIDLMEFDCASRCELLNALAFGLGDPKPRPIVWQHIVDITGDNVESALDAELVIAIYELAAEPPGVSWFLQLLFSLEHDKQRRWIIFEAHRSWPKLLLRHINQYSSGAISRSEYDSWLGAQGFVITPSGLRRPR
jgi:hypothetical protein